MRAVNLDPSDAWAVHAVAHVYEMTSRCDEAKRFLTETRDHWEVRQDAHASGRREGATLLEHHLMWHWCLFDIAAGDAKHAMARYDNKLAVREPPAESPLPEGPRAPVLALLDDVSLLWRLELNRLPASRLHGSHGPRGGRGNGKSDGTEDVDLLTWGEIDPSAPVSGSYLSFLAALRPSDSDLDVTGKVAPVAGSPSPSSPHGRSANEAHSPSRSTLVDITGRKFLPLWLPDGVEAASRWTETARHLRHYAGQHVAAFNDVHISMALVAAGDERGLSAHLDSMLAYASTPTATAAAAADDDGTASSPASFHDARDTAADGQSPAILSAGQHSISGDTAAWPPTYGDSCLSGLERVLGSGPQMAPHVEPLWAAQFQGVGLVGIDRCTTTSASSSGAPFIGAGKALLEDNRLATAAVGLDLARGMVAFWRALTAFKQAHHLKIQEGRTAGTASLAGLQREQKNGAIGSCADSTEDETSRGAFDFGSSWTGQLRNLFSSSADSATGITGKFSSSALGGVSARPQGGASADLMNSAKERSGQALSLLLRSRAQWSLLGGSLAQRDVFDQTALHAALLAGNTAVALALASERCTVRFADPNAWYLLGTALEAGGHFDRAADARNRAFALGMGSRGSG